MPSSPPPPLNEPLNTYFAVQLKDKEVAHHVAAVVLRTARGLNVLFRRLEVLDTVTVGTLTFVRMRADLLNPYPVLDQIYTDGRGVIGSMTGGEYAVRMPGRPVGKVSNLFMHAAAKLGQTRMYRGTKIKRWEAQFEPA